MAIILINKLPDNMEIEDYAREVGRKWHVGNAKNGLVYVAALEQRKQRLEVANHLEGDIPDAIAFDITEGLKPFFRDKDYFGGLKELIGAVNNRIDPVAKEQLKLAKIELAKKDAKVKSVLLNIFYWLLGLGLLAFVILRFYFRPIWIRKRLKRQEEEATRRSIYMAAWQATSANIASTPTIIKAVKENPKKESYQSPNTSYNNDYNSSSGNSNSSSSSSDNSSSYGNWGSGSSDSSSSSDSGFSGGGSSNDW